MNKKIFSLFLLTVILELTLVLASSFSVDLTSTALSQAKTSETFTITPANTSNSVDVSFEFPQIRDEQNGLIQFTANPSSFPNLNSTQTFTISTTADYSKMLIGKTYSGALIVKNSANSSDSQSITLNLIRSYCDYGEKGTNLSITRFTVNNLDGDDEEWFPLEEIEVKVRIENNNPSDGARIDTVVELGLYDSKGKEQLDLDSVDLGRIKGDDTKETTFTFTVPSDLGVDSSSYYLAVKAYQDGKKDQVCTSKYDSSFYKSITISRQDDDEKQISFTDVSIAPSPAQCGEEITLRAKVANVGDRDQEEIKIKVFSRDLMLNDYKVISDLTQDDSAKTIEFTFIVPANITEKSYTIELRSLYDFNDDYSSSDDDAYDEQSEAKYLSLIVNGNCVSPTPAESVQIIASLESEAKAGEEM
ncbi:MAG: putative S-layer protein, partial [Nanoarchaeota archaeon]|nr:putative S-layer protein [Nanoarchaeota archaeon]